MTPEAAPQKSSLLTPEAFGKFLEWLSPNREAAARQYLEIRKTLVQLFVWRGCAHSEELADTTLDRSAMIFYRGPEKYASPMALCSGVARNVWFEYLREVKPDPLDIDVPSFDKDDSRLREHAANCLGNCVDRL